MKHGDVLKYALDILIERGKEYGDVRESLETSAKIASLKLGKELSAYDVATVLESVKDARLRYQATHPDSYIDKVNYAAFRAEMATEK